MKRCAKAKYDQYGHQALMDPVVLVVVVMVV
jgi:hypothetical protein